MRWPAGYWSHFLCVWGVCVCVCVRFHPKQTQQRTHPQPTRRKWFGKSAAVVIGWNEKQWMFEPQWHLGYGIIFTQEILKSGGVAAYFETTKYNKACVWVTRSKLDHITFKYGRIFQTWIKTINFLNQQKRKFIKSFPIFLETNNIFFPDLVIFLNRIFFISWFFSNFGFLIFNFLICSSMSLQE